MPAHKFIAGALLILSAVSASAGEVVLRSVKTSRLSLDPRDPAWKQAPVSRVPLSPQNMVSPPGGGAVSEVEAQSLYSSTEIAFRLRWHDASKDSRWDLSGRFGDACALQFPLKGETLPSPFMGEKDAPVNIWRWSAVAQEKDRYPQAYADFHRRDAIETTDPFFARPAENLVAGGFGTLTRESVQDLDARGSWADGHWTVVIKRALASEGGASFRENALSHFALAVWDGANKERDGMKSVAFWQWLALGDAARVRPESGVERGKENFGRYGCATCHGPEGRGGIKNPNAQGGLVPPLQRVAEGFSEPELKQVIRDGRTPAKDEAGAPVPPLRMNAWESVIDESELDDLAKYLFSLMPEEQKDEW